MKIDTFSKLKHPYSWKTRRPVLSQGVFFVPKYYSQHKKEDFLSYAPFSLLGQKTKICIEYGSGNGGWIAQKAIEYPDKYWIAVEKKFERIKKIWNKIQKYSLKNLFLICGEAFTFTHHYLPIQCIDEIYINFPDPWPKPKHAKHRLVQQCFVEELSRIVKPEEKLFIVTDDKDYLNQILTVISENKKWISCYNDPYFVTHLENYGTSYFEELWRQKGKTIYYTQFIDDKQIPYCS